MSTEPTASDSRFDAFMLRWAKPMLMVYWPLLAIATHMPQSELDLIDFGDSGLDSPVHIGCFSLLTVLLIYTLLDKDHDNQSRSWLILPITIAGAYAVLDEITQGLFGRSVEIKDIAANFIGISMIAVASWAQPPLTFTPLPANNPVPPRSPHDHPAPPRDPDPDKQTDHDS